MPEQPTRPDLDAIERNIRRRSDHYLPMDVNDPSWDSEELAGTVVRSYIHDAQRILACIAYTRALEDAAQVACDACSKPGDGHPYISLRHNYIEALRALLPKREEAT